jgi:crotonobetainyl-CoA:carnitine CoA-transferase CaiB-like acyl-CoA transferase
MPGFLKGVRVLDLSQYLPGPFAARMLADLGADVVKVEPPGGDPVRSLDAEGKPGDSPFYRVLNAGKTVINLDLKTEAGRERFGRLVGRADVLLECFRPGVLDRLGFGPARLKEINPGLVHCALSGYGQSGPASLAAGHDLNYEAMTGCLSVSGTAERPTIPFPPSADYAGSMQTVVAILGALVGRDHGQPGCFLDVSVMESMLSWQELGMTLPTSRAGGLINGGAAGYQLYRTQDGRFVSLSPLEPKFWERFCAAVGRPEWIERRYEPMPQTALIDEIAKLFETEPLGYWDELLVPADCCYQAVLDYDEVIAHPHIAARGLVHRRNDHVEVRLPVILDGHAPGPRAPVRDASLDDVLRAWEAEAAAV